MIKKRAFSVFYMFALTLFFTAVVSGIHWVNRERIALNEEIKLQRVILKVMGMKAGPEVPNARVSELYRQRVRVETRDGKTFYRGLREDGKTPAGYAFPLVGPGFWGPLYGMMGVDPKVQTVLGIAFYRHTETPGLGGRITEPWFEHQFQGKHLTPPGEHQRYFYLRAPGTASGPNEVDAITGATGTSYAVELLIDRALKEYLPLLAGAGS